MSRRQGSRVRFIVIERRTFDALQANIVLRDVMLEMGDIVFLGRKRPGRIAGVLHRFAVLPRLVHWIVLAWLGRVTFLHFKALNFWPLKMLGRLAPSRTVFAEGSVYGETEMELQVAQIIKPRNRQVTEAIGRTLIRFRDEWPFYNDTRNAGRAHFKLDPPFASKEWTDYLDKVADRYLSAALGDGKFDPAAEIVACPIGWIGEFNIFRGKKILWTLLDEIIQIVGETLPELPLVIKPHPAAIEQAREIESLLATHGNVKGIVCHLHPMVLASRARCAISFAHTTAFGPIKSIGVPTIEYTDYSDRVLEITSGGSYRPDMVDHFINHDPEALRRLLVSLPPRQTVARPRLISRPLPDAVVDLLSARPARLTRHAT